VPGDAEPPCLRCLRPWGAGAEGRAAPGRRKPAGVWGLMKGEPPCPAALPVTPAAWPSAWHRGSARWVLAVFTLKPNEFVGCSRVSPSPCIASPGGVAGVGLEEAVSARREGSTACAGAWAPALPGTGLSQPLRSGAVCKRRVPEARAAACCPSCPSPQECVPLKTGDFPPQGCQTCCSVLSGSAAFLPSAERGAGRKLGFAGSWAGGRRHRGLDPADPRLSQVRVREGAHGAGPRCWGAAGARGAPAPSRSPLPCAIAPWPRSPPQRHGSGDGALCPDAFPDGSRVAGEWGRGLRCLLGAAGPPRAKPSGGARLAAVAGADAQAQDSAATAIK